MVKERKLKKDFVRYNIKNPKSLTESYRYLAKKYGMTLVQVKDNLSDDLVHQVKNLPSEQQLEVLKGMDCGKSFTSIADDMNITRQAVFNYVKWLVRKGYIEPIDGFGNYRIIKRVEEF